MGQFSHWTRHDIIDRFLDGMSMVRLARMTGRSVREVKHIITTPEAMQ